MLQLRPAKDSDYEYAKAVHHTAYKEMVISQFGKWEEPVQDYFFDKSWKSSPYNIIIFDEEPCGYCCIDENESTIQLLEFAVEISKQRHGIGSALLSRLKETGAEKGKRVQLNVMKTNDRAKALYERLGFNVYGENQSHFLMRTNDVR